MRAEERAQPDMGSLPEDKISTAAFAGVACEGSAETRQEGDALSKTNRLFREMAGPL